MRAIKVRTVAGNSVFFGWVVQARGSKRFVDSTLNYAHGDFGLEVRSAHIFRTRKQAREAAWCGEAVRKVVVINQVPYIINGR